MVTPIHKLTDFRIPTHPLTNFVKNNWHILLFVLIALMASCTSPSGRLEEGTYRGLFGEGERELPFNFRISHEGDQPVLTYLNAGDEFRADSAWYQGDSVVFPVAVYDAFLVAFPGSSGLEGYWARNSDPARKLTWKAGLGGEHRFWKADELAAPEADLTGRWEVTFYTNDGNRTAAIAEFRQKAAELEGTILTTTGDYRFLEGEASGDLIRLSAFSGGASSLLEARFVSPDSIQGSFGGLTGGREFIAVRNANAQLPDAFTLTYLKDGYETLDFTFPDLQGNAVSLQDEKYQGKVKIITIMGSWCPNCMDEAAFLGPWYEQNRDRGVEIIGLSFEQKDDLAFARERVGRFTKRFGVSYDVLFAGKADKQQAGEKLPALNAVLSFPTTIFIDRKGQVRKIHTGFSGPATGVHFDEFKREFNETVDTLLKEA